MKQGSQACYSQNTDTTYVVKRYQVGGEVLQFSDSRMVVRLVRDIQPLFPEEKNRPATDVVPARFKVFLK